MKHRLPPLSEMERIEQSLLIEKLDEILERIDKEDIGFVITEGGLDEMVIIEKVPIFEPGNSGFNICKLNLKKRAL